MITLKNVSKRYEISHSESYYSMRDTISNIFKHPFQKKSEFWAVKNVSFSVIQGERLGIIGRNGAGKSTLLKLISRITPITEGEIRIKGRIISLLEVGTGFHPELTGRENVFLNGAILGMKWFEIKRKFDEIVEFAEISEFLDTPVKYYSSGMFVRLAFSVAAHLEAEVMIIDEVLSVGDIGFQKKCMDKMQDLSKNGRTLLFISHNVTAIENLCTNVILMEKGRSSEKLKSSIGIKRYLNSLKKTLNLPVWKRTDRAGKGNIQLINFSFEKNNKGFGLYAVGEEILIEAEVENRYKEMTKVRLALSIATETDVSLVSCDSAVKYQVFDLRRGKSTIHCKISNLNLNYGTYHINMSILHNDDPEDWIRPVASFKIDRGLYDGFIPREHYYPILASFQWSIT